MYLNEATLLNNVKLRYVKVNILFNEISIRLQLRNSLYCIVLCDPVETRGRASSTLPGSVEGEGWSGRPGTETTLRSLSPELKSIIFSYNYIFNN